MDVLSQLSPQQLQLFLQEYPNLVEAPWYRKMALGSGENRKRDQRISRRRTEKGGASAVNEEAPGESTP